MFKNCIVIFFLGDATDEPRRFYAVAGERVLSIGSEVAAVLAPEEHIERFPYERVRIEREYEWAARAIQGLKPQPCDNPPEEAAAE